MEYETREDGKPIVSQDVEGKYVYCSWGYNQTNINFAKIIEVSDSGRTVVCRIVEKDFIEQKCTEKVIEPTDNTKRDKFRLYVREGRDLYFRGSYPFTDDGSTRRDTFFPYREDREIMETDARFGH
jgi:hypothetical protein